MSAFVFVITTSCKIEVDAFVLIRGPLFARLRLDSIAITTSTHRIRIVGSVSCTRPATSVHTSIAHAEYLNINLPDHPASSIDGFVLKHVVSVGMGANDEPQLWHHRMGESEVGATYCGAGSSNKLRLPAQVVRTVSPVVIDEVVFVFSCS